jgi:nucleoside 2-deoxyribosyltransferase
MSRPKIYIAGPFRASTPWEIEQNVRCAEAHGLLVAQLGAIPIIPHAMYRFFQDALPDEFWLEAGLRIMDGCQALSVCVAEERAGTGTTGERKYAIDQLKIPVFKRYEEDALLTWIRNWRNLYNE